MIDTRPYREYTGRSTRDARPALVALALAALVLALFAVATIVATSPSLLSHGLSFTPGSFAPAHQADYTSSGDRPVAPQRPAR